MVIPARARAGGGGAGSPAGGVAASEALGEVEVEGSFVDAFAVCVESGVVGSEVIPFLLG
jgi:hypothetical protein